MRCYDNGLLQSFLDNEVKDFQRAAIINHLTACSSCREKLERLEKNQLFTDQLLSKYLTSLGNPNQVEAWQDLQKALTQKDHYFENQTDYNVNCLRKGAYYMLKKYRGAVAAACVVLAVSLSLNFAPVRALASDFLNIFRVNNFQTVTLSANDLSLIQKYLEDGARKVTLGNLGEVEMTKTGVNGEVTLAEAKESVDFPLLQPQTLPTGYKLISYQRTAGNTLNFTLDTQKTNEVLKSFGSTTLLPDNLNGETFTAQIPVVISATYAGAGKLTITQAKSPQLITANGTDINSIRDAILALPFLPEDLRKELASINDWQHTFIVPNINGSTQNVSVAGTSGVFISAPHETGQTQRNNQIRDSKSFVHNTLLWQKNGVIYAVTGNFTFEQGLSIANSMK